MHLLFINFLEEEKNFGILFAGKWILNPLFALKKDKYLNFPSPKQVYYFVYYPLQIQDRN